MRYDKGVKIIFQIEFDYFQIENESDEEEHTPNMATLKPLIDVNYMDGNIDINLFVHTGFTEYDWVDSLIKSYTMCGCENRLAEVKGYCKECYIMTTEQEDVCCWCHENEGVWIELECKHLIHYDCWRKIEYVASTDERKKYNQKCPMCRSELSWSRYTRI